MGLTRAQAAVFVGVSPNTFNKLVSAGDLPKPRRYPNTSRLFWLASELEEALRDMPYADGSSTDPWAGVGDDPWENVNL